MLARTPASAGGRQHRQEDANIGTRKDIELLVHNRALALNVGNDYVQMPSDVYFNGDFTIECRVYPRSFNDWSRIIDF
jgi:hypothetical protein